MLSYMLPVEEKSPPSRNLNLHLNGNLNSECDEQQQQQHQQLRTMPSSTITTSSSSITTPSTNLINFERNNGNNNNNNNSVLKSSDITSMKRTLNDLKFDQNNIINNNFIDNNNTNFNNNNNNINTINNNINNNNNNNNFINNINNNSNLIGNNVGNSVGGGGGGILTTSSSDDSKKLKMSKIGNSKVTLKRVSFGSSKGSMVETLVFETPTPLPEHAEREFGFSINNNDMMGGYTMASPFSTTSQSTLPASQLLLPTTTTTTTITNNKLYYTNLLNNNHNNNNNLINNSYLDDSGIEMQEELERSKVRVTFFQSGKPQQVSSPPENHLGFFDIDSSTFPNDYHNNNNNNYLDSNLISTATNMTATTAIPPASYDRQMSTESGWDNPFRPGGDLSREADEIVNMIKGGKPITPTGDGNLNLSNGAPQMNHSTENGMAVVDGATKVEVSQVQSQSNGTKSPQKPITDKKNGDTTIPHQQQQQQQKQQQHQPQTQISNQVIPGPQSASHVVLDDKKKKKCACCVIQ